MAAEGDMDLVAIIRTACGEHPAPQLTQHEKQHAAWQLTQAGLSDTQVAAIVGASTRSILRWRKAKKGQHPMPATPHHPDTLKRDDTWREHAACSNEDPELFFPVGETGSAVLQMEEAKAVCRRCPAADECLDWALTHRVDDGIWGGLTPAERRGVKRRAARKRHKDNQDTAKQRRKEADLRDQLLVEHAKGGSYQGEKLHGLLGEPACESCLTVRREYAVERRARQKARAAA